MKYITDEDILKLDISPETCIKWVETSFLMKEKSSLPPKTSIHLHETDFFNTMPCLLPDEYDMFSVKVISRIRDNRPILKSHILLYRASTGELLAILDGNLITAMRTGAVAALAVGTLRSSKAKTYSIMGLGSMADATFNCLYHFLDKGHDTVKLLRYKQQAEEFIERHKDTGITFSIADDMESFIRDSDVIISCITRTDMILCPDLKLFKPGVLVVPVHTRGFQNCDTTFDKVYGDDSGHISGFVNFGKFRDFHEIGDVLSGKAPGRSNDMERILSYNIGLGLHDAFFAWNILDRLG